VSLAVAGEFDVVDGDHSGARHLAGGDHSQQPLIADVGTVLQSQPAHAEGGDRDAHPALGRSVGTVDAEPEYPVLGDVLEVQVLDASDPARRRRRRDDRKEGRLAGHLTSRHGAWKDRDGPRG
jgi:hypothetical protein